MAPRKRAKPPQLVQAVREMNRAHKGLKSHRKRVPAGQRKQVDKKIRALRNLIRKVTALCPQGGKVFWPSAR